LQEGSRLKLTGKEHHPKGLIHLKANTTNVLKLLRNTGTNIVVEEGQQKPDRRKIQSRKWDVSPVIF
jgi:hypothetical protein